VNVLRAYALQAIGDALLPTESVSRGLLVLYPNGQYSWWLIFGDSTPLPDRGTYTIDEANVLTLYLDGGTHTTVGVCNEFLAQVTGGGYSYTFTRTTI
jgi:hypothetical protein